MQIDKLKLLLEQVQSGQVDVDTALEELRHLPFENLDGFATLDHHRSLRNGFPEVVFGQGKQPAQIVSIVRRLSEHNDKVLVTRVDKVMADEIQAELPELTYHPLPRLLVLDRSAPAEKRPGVLVVTAGTADMPVAEEAAITSELMGNAVERMFDVGVAGIHRSAQPDRQTLAGKCGRGGGRYGRCAAQRGRRVGFCAGRSRYQPASAMAQVSTVSPPC